MKTDSGIIFNIKHFAVHDGPGIRTTVFFKGCPLSCRWCHNPESINPNIEEIEVPYARFSVTAKKCGKETVGKKVQVSEIMSEVLKDVIFYDESGGGITISGGEPLMQPDFLFSLLKECKIHNIHTCVDTSGYAPRKIIERIVDYVDIYLYDIKLLDNEEHVRYTGVKNDRIIQNLEYLCEKNKKVIIRIPIIPDITDTEENIAQLGGYISSLKCVIRVDILPYNQFGADKYRRLEKPYQLNNTNPPSDERMLQLKEKLETFNLQVKIGG